MAKKLKAMKVECDEFGNEYWRCPHCKAEEDNVGISQKMEYTQIGCRGVDCEEDWEDNVKDKSGSIHYTCIRCGKEVRLPKGR